MTVLSDSRCYHEGGQCHRSLIPTCTPTIAVCTAQDILQNLPITVGALRRVGISRYADTHHA
jgi:hypothetical protein